MKNNYTKKEVKKIGEQTVAQVIALMHEIYLLGYEKEAKERIELAFGFKIKYDILD